MRTGAKVGVGIGAGLALLIGGAGITYAVLAAQRTPEAVATGFLQALVDGEAEAALTFMTPPATGNPVLLTDEVYSSAEDRITAFSIDSISSDGDVTVTVTQAGEKYEHVLTMALVRRDLRVLDVWRVETSNLSNVYVSYARPEAMSLTVEGEPFGVLAGSFDYDIQAFPGTYDFEPTGGTEYYDAQAVAITTRFGTGDDSIEAPMPVTLTEAGMAAATAAVNAQLDACVAQPVLIPTGGCGLGVAAEPGTTYTNMRWAIVQRPTFTFGAWREQQGWALVLGAPGNVRWDADYETSSEYGTSELVYSDYVHRGWITSVSPEGVAVFESSYED